MKSVKTALMFCSIVACTSATAGTQTVNEIKIRQFSQPSSNGAIGSIQGSMGSARSSDDSLQYLNLSTWGNGIFSISARDKNGVVKSCMTSDPADASKLNGATNDAHLYVQYKANGDCGFIRVSNASTSEPKI